MSDRSMDAKGLVVLHNAVATLPIPASRDVAPTGPALKETALYSRSGAPPRRLKFELETDTAQTVINVTLWFRIGGIWGPELYPGVGVHIFPSQPLIADFPHRFQVDEPGNPTHMLISMSFVGLMTVRVRGLVTE